MSLSSLQKFCPAFLFSIIQAIYLFFVRLFSKKHKNQSISELQEQQFQFSTKLVDVQQKSTKKSRQKQRESLFQMQGHDNDDKLNIKINLKNNHTEDEQKISLNTVQQQQESMDLKLKQYNFNLNLQPYHDYYNLIQSKTKNLKDLFQMQTKNIIKRQSKSEISINEIQTISGYRMILTYKLPCSYSYFKKVNEDQDITTSVNNIISSQKTLEVLQSNLTINHLSFRKIMLLQPRYFHYLKYENSTQNHHWSICSSIKARAEVQQKEKECQMTSISCYEERGDVLVCNTYLEVDLKSNIKAIKVVMRVYQQMANYIEWLYAYIKDNYREESS